MIDHDLNPSEARAIIRRHVHDLRNMLNSMDLEVACLLEDLATHTEAPAVEKIRNQLMLTERLVRSLSVRFMEPSLSVAAATDLFHHWHQQLHKLPQGPHIRWDEPACDAAITVDFSGVAAVLSEICLQANSTGELIAAIAEADGLVIYSVREPASKKAHHDMPPEAQQWLEWERLATISGGRLDRTYDEPAAHTVTSLRFPSVL